MTFNTLLVPGHEPESPDVLLTKAYESAPKKRVFLNKLSELPGVVYSHDSLQYVMGYHQCVQDNNIFSDDLVVVSSAVRSFIVKDLAEFRNACEAVFTRKIPDKMLVKMLAMRINHVLQQYKVAATDERYQLDVRVNHEPTLSTKELVHKFVDEKCPHYLISGAHKKLRKLVLMDIPDHIYYEAWDLVQVKEVMES